MTRLYTALLRLYPRWFRDRYGAELIAAFEADRAHDRHRGCLGACRFWAWILRDLAISASRARRRRLVVPKARQESGGIMEALVRDCRHAARQLWARPGFSAVAILSLALGIGGNAAMFGFVDGFILRPFAYPDVDRIVAIAVTFPRVSNEERFIEAFSPLEFLDIQRAATLTSMAAFDVGNRSIAGGDRPERVLTGLALTDPFGPFGLAPALGRGFTSEELQPRGPSVAVLSHRLWQGRFGGDPGIVGRAVHVNGTPTTVVGIMPPELLIFGVDLWVPWGGDPLEIPRNLRQFTLIGRLAPGATLSQTNAELAAIAQQTAAVHGERYQEYGGLRLSATPWVEALVRDFKPWARLLLGAVALVLLIACANLSSLLLARSTTRQREMAVRLALGAGRAGIARQLLTEVVLLAVLGGVAGILFAVAGLPALVSLVPTQINSLGMTASINGHVLAWAALLTIGSAAMVALLPVFQLTRSAPQDFLRASARGTTAAASPRRLRRALVVSEIALAVMLLAGAGLMLRSFAKLQNIDLGFNPANVLTMRITLPAEKYRGGTINRFFHDLVDRLAQAPAVRGVSVASQFPPRGPFTTPVRIEGIEASEDTLPSALITAASAGHFAALGVPLVSGRSFERGDRAGAPAVAIVNKAFVSRYLSNSNALGSRVRIGPADRPSPPMEIVGIVANTQNRGVREAASPEIFVPLDQQLNNQLYLLVRGEGDAGALLPLVRQQIAAIDPDQPIYSVQTLEEVVAAATFGPRLSAILFAVFAAVALTLAALGIYGVMSHAVSARTQEIGVRMAVGAARHDVLRLVLGEVARLAAVGVGAGLIGVLAAGRLLRRGLYEMQPTDPLTIAFVVVVLASVALVAGWLPAWRASRVNPLSALRAE
jgi:predicted permease